MKSYWSRADFDQNVLIDVLLIRFKKNFNFETVSLYFDKAVLSDKKMSHNSMYQN